jgi:hypothetical protein
MAIKASTRRFWEPRPNPSAPIKLKRYNGFRVSEYGPTTTNSLFFFPDKYREHQIRPNVPTMMRVRLANLIMISVMEPLSQECPESRNMRKAAMKKIIVRKIRCFAGSKRIFL